MLEVFRRLGSIQFDPLAIAGRTHDLVLHARVADYDPAWCDLLYERRVIFEAYNKGLSFVPADEFPWFRGTWSRTRARVLAENTEVAERVLERIRAEGPLSALDFERERGTTTDWFGMPTNTVRPCSRRTPSRACSASRDATATAATTTCSNGCYRRTSSRATSRSTEQLRHKLLSRYRAHGLLGVSGADDMFGGIGDGEAGPAHAGEPGSERASRGARRTRRARSGRSGGRDRQALRPTRGGRLLEAPPEPPPSVAFLPPFDPLVWDRAPARELFAFDYVWELFIPPAKRRWGWYVLPIVFRGPLRRPDRAAHRAGRAPGWRSRPLVGGRLRAAPRRGLRRRDAGCASRLPALRRRNAPGVAAAPRNGEAAVSRATLES